jgi:hypothetical protein
MENLSESTKGNNANTLLCEVYLCIVETEKRLLTIISKNKILSDIEKTAIENEYGKISGIYNNVGSNVGVLLNFA